MRYARVVRAAPRARRSGWSGRSRPRSWRAGRCAEVVDGRQPWAPPRLTLPGPYDRANASFLKDPAGRAALHGICRISQVGPSTRGPHRETVPQRPGTNNTLRVQASEYYRGLSARGLRIGRKAQVQLAHRAAKENNGWRHHSSETDGCATFFSS